MIRFILLMALITGACASAWGKEPSDTIRAGFPIYAFTGLESSEAEVAADFYIKKVVEDVGLTYQSHIYNDSLELIEDMKAGKLDFVLLTSAEYSTLPIRDQYEPILVPVRGDVVNLRLMLLTRKDKQLDTLESLAGKRLLMACGSDCKLELTWLSQILSNAGLPPLTQHFKSIEYPQAIAKAVLPVFFGKADACVVSESLYTTVTELNPQVAERLQAVAVSDKLLGTILCLRKGYSQVDKSLLIKGATNLTKTPDGKQLLVLTRLSYIEPFKPEHMISTDKLMHQSTDHSRLVNSIAVPKPPLDKIPSGTPSP